MQKMARRHNKEGGNHLEQESNRQKAIENIDGGLHPAMDGQSLGERCGVVWCSVCVCTCVCMCECECMCVHLTQYLGVDLQQSHVPAIHVGKEAKTQTVGPGDIYCGGNQFCHITGVQVVGLHVSVVARGCNPSGGIVTGCDVMSCSLITLNTCNCKPVTIVRQQHDSVT